MCFKLKFIKDLKDSIEDLKDSIEDLKDSIEDSRELRRCDAIVRKGPQTFNPDHLERLRENFVQRHRWNPRTVEEIAARDKSRPLRHSDLMVEGPVPDHLKTREMQWQHLLQEYQRALEHTDSLTYEREFNHGEFYVEEPLLPEEIRAHKARLQVMIDAIKKKIDAESTAALQSDAGSSWSEYS